MITNSKEILSQDEKTALRERIQDICKKAVSELMDPTSIRAEDFSKAKTGETLVFGRDELFADS